jgi:hypothetical protein
MLSRQVAPLLRKFCKVSAYFTITTQHCHALTMLRSLKVILNFRTHAMWPMRLVPKLPARQQYHQVLKGARHASRHGRAHFGRLVNAVDMGGKLPRIWRWYSTRPIDPEKAGPLKGFGANIQGSRAPEQRLSITR